MHRLSAFIALAIIWTTSAIAASPAPTLVENAYDPVNQPYQVEATSSGSCTGPCYVTFPTITTGRVVVLHASCFFSFGESGVTVTEVYLQSGRATNVLPTFSSNGVYYSTNAETYLFYATGTAPLITLDFNAYTNGAVSCTLSGYYR